MKKIFLDFLLLLIIFEVSSCKKTIDTKELIIGKWKVDSVQVRMLVNNQVTYQTIYKPSVDYYDFRADNKLYQYWNSNYDTLSYEIISLNGKSIIQYAPYSGGDTIITLTKRSLIFKSPQGSDSKVFFTKE